MITIGRISVRPESAIWESATSSLKPAAASSSWKDWKIWADPRRMLSGSFDTRTMDRVNFMLRLSFISGKDIRQVIRCYITIKIIINQDHRTHSANAQATDGFERETPQRVGLARFELQLLLEPFP